MTDALDEPDGKPPPHPSARVIAEALASISCVLVGLLVGGLVQHVFSLWSHTPEVFMVLSAIVLPRIMRRLGYRWPPKPVATPSNRLRDL